MRDNLYWIGILLLAMWLIYFVDAIIPADLTEYGLRPRSLWGFLGIPLSPLLHSGLGHLLGNTIPLVILLWLLASSRRDAWWIAGTIVLVGGGLLWVFGRDAIHVGASGLVFGLIAFLIAAGFIERHFISIAIAFLVALFFGTTLIWGVIPKLGSAESWEGHLTGAIAGVVVAYAQHAWKTSSRVM